MQYLDAISKITEHLCLFPRQKSITVIQVYFPTSNAEDTGVEWFYEDLQDLPELIPPPQKNVLFIIGDKNAKLRNQEIQDKFGLGVQNEAGQRLIEICQKNALVIANTLFQQHEMTLHMDITKCSIPKSN